MYYNNTRVFSRFYALFINIFAEKWKNFLQNACYIKNNSYLCTVQVRNATSITMTHQTICNV